MGSCVGVSVGEELGVFVMVGGDGVYVAVAVGIFVAVTVGTPVGIYQSGSVAKASVEGKGDEKKLIMIRQKVKQRDKEKDRTSPRYFY